MKYVPTPRTLVGRKSNNLGSKDRAGRFARDEVWKDVLAHLKRYWFTIVLLLIPFILFATLIAVLPLTNSEIFRWISVGVVGASGFWLSIILIILSSGIAPKLMGIEGENLTSQVLKDFANKEWRLINGLRFKGRGDIDHILIGPGGIFIFESKWSGERWPMELHPKGFMGRQVNGAIKQVKRNKDDLVGSFGKMIGNAPLYVVCVFWSAKDSRKDDKFFFRDLVFGVRGPELSGWLADRPNGVIDGSEISRISKFLEAFAHQRDLEDSREKVIHRQTLDHLFFFSFLLPLIGFFVPLFILVGAAQFHSNISLYLSSGVLAIIGICIRYVLKMKALAFAWLAGLLGVWLYVFAIVVDWISL